MKKEKAFAKCLDSIEESTNISLDSNATMHLYYQLEALMRCIGKYETLDEQLSASIFCLSWMRGFVCNKVGVEVND